MILHARMDLGDTELLVADVSPERHQPMRSAYLSLSLNGTQEAERFAMLRDRFGAL